MDINGKKIILTGASSGIGKEILEILASYKDVKIIAVAQHTENITYIENTVYPFSADVSTKKGVDALFNYAEQTIGDIDIFIANAGFAYLEKMKSADWQHIEYIYNLNVFSPIYSLQKLTAKEDSKPKLFACTISGAAFVSLPAYSLYCSTKAALHHFIETYRYEKEANLQITAIYPVATRTDFFDKAAGKSDTPLPYMSQEASTVAKKIVKGIERGKKKIYPSFLFRIAYPIGRAFPIFLKLYSMIEKEKVRQWLRS